MSSLQNISVFIKFSQYIQTQEFVFHKDKLIRSSQYFEIVILECEELNLPIKIILPTFATVECLIIFKDFINNRSLNIDHCEIELYKQLVLLSTFFKCTSLIDEVEHCFSNKLNNFNAIDIYNFSSSQNRLETLNQVAWIFIVENFESIYKNEQWSSLRRVKQMKAMASFCDRVCLRQYLN